MSFCDLDGDGKVTPEEEFDTFMMMRMAAKSSKNGSYSGSGKPGSGCLGPMFVFGVCLILIIAGIGNCVGGCGGYYPPAFPSYTYSSPDYSGYSSTPKKDNSVEQQSQSPTSSRSKSSSKSNSKSSSKSKSSEEFDMDDFADAEDFYEWYKDDFIDYEDAEEYYEEHDGGLR